MSEQYDAMIKRLLNEKSITIDFGDWDYNQHEAKLSYAHNGLEDLVQGVDVYGHIIVNSDKYSIMYQNTTFAGTYNLSNDLEIYYEGTEKQEAEYKIFELITSREYDDECGDESEDYDLMIAIQNYMTDLFSTVEPELSVNRADKDFEINVFSLRENRNRVLEHTFYGDVEFEDETEY